MRARFFIGVGLVGLSCAAATFGAEEPGVIASRIFSRETWTETDHMTGDWGGWRTRLVENGVHFRAGYTAEYLANVSGGVKRGGVYAGLFEMGLDVDSSKLFGLEGNEFHVSSIYPHGGSISEYSGDISAVSNIDAYDTFRLFELWVQQSFWADRFSVRVGQLAADEEFAVTDHGAIFLNSAFGFPPSHSLNTAAPVYPVAAPGVRVQFNATEELSFIAGVFDGDPGEEAVNSSGTRVRLGSDEGALLTVEAIYAPDVGENGRVGTYKLGGWYHSGDFEHQRIDDTGLSLADAGSSGNPAAESGNWGIYFVVDQGLWRESGEESEQGLNGFLRFAGSPSDRNVLGYYVDGGLTYRGLIAGRDEDVFGLAGSYIRLGEETRRLSRELGGSLDYEIAIEATYEMKVNTWWSLQPDAQLIIHPGGSGEMSNAFVIGLRSNFVF